jgi:hypothetical protein
MPAQPSLPEIVEAAHSRHVKGLHTACVGTIVSYDSDEYTATVQPQDLDGVTPAPLEECPVAIPGAWAAGDPCLIVFGEEDFGPDLSSTGETRRHGLSAAMIVPLIARSGQTTDFVALAALVDARLETIRTTWTFPTGMGPTGTAAAGGVPALDSVAATKLRAR